FLAQEGNVAIHGFAEAARSFFDKEIQDLSLEEIATLAAIVKAPTTYSPRRHPDEAKARRIAVLHRMREFRYITAEQEDQAKAAELTLAPTLSTKRTPPFDVYYVTKIVLASVALPHESNASFKISSAPDREYQRCADDAVQRGISDLEKKF